MQACLYIIHNFLKLFSYSQRQIYLQRPFILQIVMGRHFRLPGHLALACKFTLHAMFLSIHLIPKTTLLGDCLKVFVCSGYFIYFTDVVVHRQTKTLGTIFFSFCLWNEVLISSSCLSYATFCDM